jgi:hypothetical protein
MPAKKSPARKHVPKNHDPFAPVMHHGIGGAVYGLIAGLVLGLAIQGIMMFLVGPTADPEFLQIAPFFGMGLGSLIGAILGGLAGLKE